MYNLLPIKSDLHRNIVFCSPWIIKKKSVTEVKKMGDSEKTKSGSGSLLVFVFAVVDVAIGASVSLTSKYSAF